ncbi:MAG: hypothetical protein NT157_03170 [Candidatus Micrarchaeota archaeon]|nr:hypothetical protein [Candidatus Micrarchaeota archaeon]
MEFYDLHVRFEFPDFSDFGFSKVGVAGAGVNDVFESNSPDKKAQNQNQINILVSSKVEVLRIGAKKFEAIYPVGFYPDLEMLRNCAKSGCLVEFPLAPLLASSGAERSKIINRMRLLLSLCIKYKAGYAITSMAKDKFGVRRPEEMVAIGMLLGLSREQALASVSSYPAKIFGNSGGIKC